MNPLYIFIPMLVIFFAGSIYFNIIHPLRKEKEKAHAGNEAKKDKLSA